MSDMNDKPTIYDAYMSALCSHKPIIREMIEECSRLENRVKELEEKLKQYYTLSKT